MKLKITFLFIFFFGLIATTVYQKNKKVILKTSYAGAYGGKSRAPFEISIDKNNLSYAEVSVTTSSCQSLKVKYRSLPISNYESSWINLNCNAFEKQTIVLSNLDKNIESLVFDVEMQTSNQAFTNSFEMTVKQKNKDKNQIEKMSDGSLIKINPVNPTHE